MRLPPARVTVPLAEVWRHWRVTELVTGFSRPAGFDVGWSLAGRVRGALGHALLGEGAVTRRHGVPSAFDVLFGDPAVMPAGDGALFANPTRPFVMLADASGERVEVRLRLFGWAAVLSRELAVALARGLEAGISLAPGARTRARIEADPVRRLEPRIEPPAAHAGGVHITFLSPVAFEREGAMAADRDMLVSSLMARLAGLGRWHGFVLEGDWQRLAEAESGMALDGARLRPVGFERVSLRQGRRIPMHGLLGTCTLEGDLEPFLPLLALAPWVHLGSHTAFGMGRCHLTTTG